MGSAPARTRWNATIVVLGLWALTLVLLGCCQGFGGPSYPYGLVSGVLVGPLGALLSAHRAARSRLRGAKALGLGVSTGAMLAATIAAVALVHGLRLGFCEFAADFERLLLGPGIGAILAGLWGVAAAQWASKRWLRYTLALILPLGGYVASFGRFYTSPMVFAFDHFAGYFAGTLYDTELGSLTRLWTYRAGTLGLFTLLAALLLLAEVPVLMWWTRRGTVGIGVAGLGLTTGVYLAGPELGHYQTTATIVAALGDDVTSARCDVVFDSSIGFEGAALLARECDSHVHELEHDLEVTGPSRIRVFLFASADQKAALMGARHVYVAKPWREEIYINASTYPHPVLRHELAHVVAGAFAAGPFRVAGSAWGLVPDPGRIEGIAVMAAPPEDETLTLAQWSAAMRRLGIMPPLSSLFQLGFFGSNSSSAYTVAGAFLEWVAANHGISSVKAWYGGASLEVLTRSTWAELEHAFGQFLDQIAVNDTELDVARSRFERPAVLQRRCPHQVDGALTLGLQWLARGNCDKAQSMFDQVLSMDASALRAEFGRAECAQRGDNSMLALQLYQNVADSKFAGSDFKTAAWERAGDVAWQQGTLERATELYQRAQTATLDEDNLRQLDIKLAAIASPSEQERVGVERFFFGAEHKGAFPLYTGNLLGEWVAHEPVGLASYLLGKQYLAASQWKLAGVRLRQALAGNLKPRVRREALRGLLIAGCAANDKTAATDAWRDLATDHALTTAQLAGFAAIARRCGATI